MPQAENFGKIEMRVKQDLFERISGKSVKEAEVIFADLAPTLLGQSPEKPKLVEKEKLLSMGHKQITFVADAELVGMLTRLQEVTSHQRDLSHGSTLELLKLTCKIALQKLVPIERVKRTLGRKEKAEQKTSEEQTSPEKMSLLDDSVPTSCYLF